MSSPWVVIRPRLLPLSMRLDARAPWVLLSLGLVTLAGMILSVGVGEYWVSPLDVLRTVLGIQTGNSGHAFMVNTLRLPRVLVAVLVGAALGLSGAIMQGLTRNALASPELTDVMAGASLAVVTLLVLSPTVSASLLPVGALAGGSTVAAVIYALAWKGGDSPIRLILVGIGLTVVLGGLTTVMVTLGEIDQVTRALIWLAGSIYGRGWDDVRVLIPWLLVFVPVALLMSRQLNALNLGEDIARRLGSRVERERGLLLLTAAALAAAAVTVAGTVSFVGLMAPHIARRLAGPSHEGLMPTTAATGALIVVLADLLGRTLFTPIEIPVGVVTASVGAPFFMYLLYRDRNK